MPSLVVIGPQIKEKQRGGGHNVYGYIYSLFGSKDPSLNRVKVSNDLDKYLLRHGMFKDCL